MRIHSIEKIEELKRLRRKGLSINELVVGLSIPKTTVWHYIRDVKVPPKYVAILRARQGGSAERKQKNLERARKRAQELLQGPNRDLSIVIAMLYWAEGSKKGCRFINSDGRMIKSYLTILRNVFDIPEEFIKPTMRIYSGMDRKECLNYWSRITKISKHKFIIRFNDGGTRGRTRYGMCRIRIKKGGDISKLIDSLIEQVSQEIIRKA
ncbi:hypothetical protein KKC63_02780 [Patescibacteria group bacterium]|nr:hypothetical protein [Patescibacteria group bacterium]MBU4023097.1 hypothetical protein [Patescibacteria group bacterium]MBU4078341.1 hypothetical protein [Patescibacteria group bacterium]